MNADLELSRAVRRVDPYQVYRVGEVIAESSDHDAVFLSAFGGHQVIVQTGIVRGAIDRPLYTDCGVGYWTFTDI